MVNSNFDVVKMDSDALCLDSDTLKLDSEHEDLFYDEERCKSECVIGKSDTNVHSDHMTNDSDAGRT